MSTLRTLARRIARVNQDNGDAVQFCLVLDKHSQLKETPTVALCSVSLFSPNPRTNARQIFEGDSLLRVFGFQNNRFADFVIQLSGEEFLFLRTFHLVSFRSGRAFSFK